MSHCLGCEWEQLISVISLLSQEIPDCNSPANVDAAVSVFLSLSHSASLSR